MLSADSLAVAVPSREFAFPEFPFPSFDRLRRFFLFFLFRDPLLPRTTPSRHFILDSLILSDVRRRFEIDIIAPRL